MSITPSSTGKGTLAKLIRKRAALLLTTALMAGSTASVAHADGDTLRILTYNIWNKLKQDPQAAAQLLVPGNYDAVLFQEENGSRFVTDLPGILEDAGLGTYQGARNGSAGIISRLEGNVGTVTLPGAQSQQVAAADCQRMVWQNDPNGSTDSTDSVGGRWVIGPGDEPAEAPSLWPGSPGSFDAGYQWLEVPQS